jgi:DNA polymerase III epsilon subunit family exonuclease
MMQWADRKWLCIDSETTGIDPVNDRIVELGAVEFHQGQPLRRMGMLVQPGIAIPEQASAIHGIRDADVSGCPSLSDIADRFLTHVRSAEVLVGYNWPFDAAFLHAALGSAWLEAICDKPVIDVLVVVRLDSVGRYWKGTGRHRLDAVADQLDVPREGRSHRASSDCVLTCRILWKLRAYLPQDADGAVRLLAAERQRQERDFEAWKTSKSGMQSG